METEFSQQIKEETDDFFFFKLEDKWDAWVQRSFCKMGQQVKLRQVAGKIAEMKGEAWEGQQEDGVCFGGPGPGCAEKAAGPLAYTGM